MMRTIRRVVAVAAVGVAALAAGAAAGPGDVFEITAIHKIDVTVSPSEWAVLQTSAARGSAGLGGANAVAGDGRVIHTGSGFRGYFPWAHANVTLDGVALRDAGLRYKGNLSFSSSSAASPFRANFKLKLDLFDEKQDWEGIETLNIHAGVVDATLMREAVAYHVFRAAGVPAPRTSYGEITFTVPGTYDRAPGGRYLLIENISRRLMRRVAPPGTGLLMKPEGLRGGISSYGDSWASYVETYRPEREATPHEQQRVIGFAKLVSQPDVPLFRSQIGTYLDVDLFLRYIAVNAFLSNWDSYLNGSHNFYLYLDPRDDKFRFLPWDEDLSLGGRNNQPIDIARPIPRDNALIYWLLDDPAVSARYRAILQELSSTAFARPALMDVIAALERALGTSAGPIPTFIDGRLAALQQVIDR